MQKIDEILSILTDGKFHSGEVLGQSLGITRSAVWKHLKTLERQGVELYAVRGKGYRMASPVELLGETEIRKNMDAQTNRDLGHMEIHQSLESTNLYLMKKAREGVPSGSVCIAETQTKGRGRRGRTWVSPYGGNIYLSILWRTSVSPMALEGLSLVIGVAVAQAVAEIGVRDAGVKWPNDLYWQGRKLGGILLEVSGETTGPCHVVIGVGINMHLPVKEATAIDQPWVDIKTILPDVEVSRTRLTAMLLTFINRALHEFQEHGIGSFLQKWKKFDLVTGRQVDLRLPDKSVSGKVVGIDERGALILQSAEGIKSYSSGEVSLRLST